MLRVALPAGAPESCDDFRVAPHPVRPELVEAPSADTVRPEPVEGREHQGHPKGLRQAQPERIRRP